MGSLLINEDLSSEFKVSERAINEDDGQSHQYQKKCIEEDVLAMVLVSTDQLKEGFCFLKTPFISKLDQA